MLVDIQQRLATPTHQRDSEVDILTAPAGVLRRPTEFDMNLAVVGINRILT